MRKVLIFTAFVAATGLFWICSVPDLQAHHVGNRPDSLMDPENVHSGIDDWWLFDPNGEDFPEEPENRPDAIGPDTDSATVDSIRSGRDNRRDNRSDGRENRRN